MSKKPKQQRKSYKGDLNKPILIPSLWDDADGIITELDNEKFIRKLKEHKKNNNLELLRILSDEGEQKLNLLLDHYGLSTKNPDWKSLALNLARDHIEGFKVQVDKPRKYAGEVWSPLLLLKLYMDINYTKENRIPPHLRKTTQRAAEILAKDKWAIERSRGKKGFKAGVLKSRYSEAKTSPLVLYFSNSDDPQDEVTMSFLYKSI